MLLGAIADDFTGASDLANTLARGGMSTVQFVGTGRGKTDCEAGVVALKTRSAPVDDAVRQSLEAARWLLEQGCEQIVFKYSSTFDSTPSGNIGPVAEALLRLTGTGVAVVCPAFPATGRRLFMGHLFVGDRLLSESGMQNHPLTPMTDPDIRRWLRQQTKGEIGSITLDVVRSGAAALCNGLRAELTAGHRLVVVDAIEDGDLTTIAAAVADHKLVTGGSGFAQGLPQNFRNQGKLSGMAAEVPPVDGPGVVICGSCSTTSQNQVACHLQNHPGLAIDPAVLMRGSMSVERAARWVEANAAENPIVYSTAAPEVVSFVQQRFGRENVAGKIETFFGGLARRLADAGMRQIVVGGGETSGAVVEALGLKNMMIGPEIDPGVPVLVADRAGPLGLALKSGNFGAPDFFAKALDRIAGHE
ncbi:3-oxo-tetronate kinase [Rhizobium leguminosarum]|uniref:3-oxo-tetronate kinase n=1 Tax=Rhizobium leguminosarum TaxID=384 RepID=UPI001C97AB3B|nr:3-oxo-tetronate kinase [Rhizobium leguminosarum]MBY5329139.1 four-carbon acid sugar kinase family protein [Rhizobium leguminosarum]